MKRNPVDDSTPQEHDGLRLGRIASWAENTIRPLKGTLKRTGQMNLFPADGAAFLSLAVGLGLFMGGIGAVIDNAGSLVGWFGTACMAASPLSLRYSRKFSQEAEERANWFFLEDGKTASPAGWDSIGADAELPAGLADQKEARRAHELTRAEEKRKSSLDRLSHQTNRGE